MPEISRKSAVYHCDPTGRMERSLIDKLRDLFKKAGGREIFNRGDSVAVKFHCGEEENTSYLNPAFARALVSELKELDTRPFLIDTNTLYRGQRHETAAHLATAHRHGFGPDEIGAPVVISSDFKEVNSSGRAIRVAREFVEADAALLITHVTGHVIFGYAGAVKNVAMGLASPAEKQVMHSDLKPRVKEEKCIACGTCVRVCPVEAVSIREGGKAVIDTETCIGCGECVAVCPVQAIPIHWETEIAVMAEKTAAQCAAALADKRGKTLCFNFLLSVAPDCDCCSWSDPPFVPDLGVLASRDILAIEQASLDLVAGAPLIPGSPLVARYLKKNPPGATSEGVVMPNPGEKFPALFDIDVEVFQAAAEREGLGKREYRLLKVS